MGETFHNGQTLNAEDLNNMIIDIERLKLYSTCIKPGTNQNNERKIHSLIGGLGADKGNPSYTNDDGSLAFGKGLVTNRQGEIAFGCYNDTFDANQNIVFSIGDGLDDTNRSNLFSISSDGIVKIKENILATTSYVDTIRDNINKNIQTLKENTIANYDTKIQQLEKDIGGLNTNLIGFKSKYFYPVGSVYISTINYENPADLSNEEVLGKGTWKLIDKEFKSVADSLDSFDKSNNTDYATINNIYYVRAGHAIRLRIYLTLSTVLMKAIMNGELEQEESTKLTIAHITLANLGVSSFQLDLLNIPILSDKGECLFMANIKKDGTIELTDHIAKSVGLETTQDCGCYINLDITCPMVVMDSGACDKFYYERVGDIES